MGWDSTLLTPDDTPSGLTGPRDRPPTRRFDVYRNNVMSSLVGAMRDGFSVVHRLVGEDFFAAMAAEFIRRSPPRSPCLSHYGADFGDFIAGFPPAASVPYLGDIARLEFALRRAYHAADVTPVGQEVLADPDIARARLTLAPAVQVISSAYPVFDIWRANMDRSAPSTLSGAQSVLVTRPDWDPVAEPITQAEANFLSALPNQTLGEAAVHTDDLAPILARLMARKSIINVEVPA